MSLFEPLALITSPYDQQDEFDLDFASCLDFLGSSLDDDLTVDSFAVPDLNVKKRKATALKQDFRRLFPTLFFRMANSIDYTAVLSYFANSMNQFGGVNVVYAASSRDFERSPREPEFHLHVDGSHAAAFYVMFLGVFFPDMIVVCSHGHIVTAAGKPGCKLLLHTSFQCTQISDVSFKQILIDMAIIYDEYKVFMAMAPPVVVMPSQKAGKPRAPSIDSYSSKSSEATITTSSRSTEDRKWYPPPARGHRTRIRSGAKGGLYDANHGLEARVHEYVDKTPHLLVPVRMHLTCTYQFVLDGRNNISDVTIAVVREV